MAFSNISVLVVSFESNVFDAISTLVIFKWFMVSLESNASAIIRLAPFDPLKKKKKKVVMHDAADDFVEQLAEKTESLSECTDSQSMLCPSCWQSWVQVSGSLDGQQRLVVKGKICTKKL
ncbi:hypothetical protein L6452_42904 [Arctium lappa]|uniref:Uncharacterized protein n=1 Tax=Arctium lappa TaxID=4217 RepID=A0ACB8XJJ2_ARCLA|nr:hypothetical protein L6452_42904 [Arctium lappa]